MRSRGSLLARLCLGAVLGSVAGLALAAATLYKWVDENGVTHYSDRPAPGAERVKILPAQSYKSPPASTVAATRPDKLPAAAGAYTRVEIASPADGEVLQNTGGTINVSATVEPALAASHLLWFTLDGTRQTEPAGGSLTASLEVSRGSHTLTALITDSGGRELIASPPVTFTVRQTSAASPPAGPLVPKKKPGHTP